MSTTNVIRAAEIWLPAPDGAALLFGGGLYGNLQAFAQESRPLRFPKGVGLPGEAWAARHPIVMKSFEGTTFQRKEAAAAAGLTSGIAMPIFAGAEIKAVVVMFCADDERHVGVVEVWKLDPEEDAQIGLHDGYYGGAELFRISSQMTRFGKGFGLPGQVWASGMPIVMREIFQSGRFLRREEALRVGLTLGLGLPFHGDPGRLWVMVFLSALGTPIASRFEIWLPDEARERLVFDAGLSEREADGDDAGRPPAIGPDQAFLGSVLRTALPAITEDCGRDAPWLLAPDDRGPSRSGIAIPTLDPSGALLAVTAWRF